ncbi:hypothetical protein JOL79_20825 [Microbispora sp. RL4-1S]|uniref:Protein kinase domain-containing protein n=1 Tax=Microbispora oryzae TaxID=2806554 RepID=A0A941ALG8_9ACTN|nr:lanthionine synthetase LanC family protein [Microbispora oryzae]MBP2706258.1 hypothetical protein [Microbispora oryzae]
MHDRRAPGPARAERIHARYARALEAFAAELPDGWKTRVHRDDPVSWRVFQHAGESPEQGWKLHVSASAADALDLLEIVLPELVAGSTAFKLPGDLRSIISINAGLAGRPQVGKIVTVYPSSDDALPALIDRLDAVWRPHRAPAVTSDLPVGRGGALFIRYGAFVLSEVITDYAGAAHAAVRAPDGSLHPDVRHAGGRQPSWAVPPVPPAARTVTTEPDGPIEVDGATYVPLKVLTADARGYVALGVRPDDRRLVIIRHRLRGVDGDEFGNDVLTRLENEWRLMRRLSGSGIVPEPLAYDPEAGYLILTDAGEGRLECLPAPERLRLLPELAAVVARLHALGVVHRDLKLSNVRIGPDGPCLVDLEVAAPTGTRHPPPWGTDGHVAPEGTYATAAPPYDVYSLGSCVTHAVVGHCPGTLPPGDDAGRQIGLLLRLGQRAAASVVRECHHPDPALRPAAGEVAERLKAALPAILAERAAGPDAYRGALDRRWATAAAASAGTATRLFGTAGCDCGRTHHDLAEHEPESLHAGAAGVIVALATLDTALGTSQFGRDIAAAAGRLAGRPPSARAHGFFTGDSGVAVALAVAGRRLGRDDLVRAARRRYEHAAGSAVADYDLFSGAAGIVWAGCLLDAVLGSSWGRDLAGRQVARIVAAARPVEGVAGWPPDPEQDPCDRVYRGAAHGTAGVAMALASWARSTGDAATAAFAREAFLDIAAHGLTEDGTTILSTAGGSTRVPHHWCHGMAGFLWCLLQACPATGRTEGLKEARQAAVAAFDRVTPLLDNPTMCHGLAGVLEVWRMVGALPGHRDTARRRVALAAECLRLLRRSRDGATVWASDDPSVVIPDLWTGFLGPAVQLALAATGSPHALLSPSWLRACALPG